MDELFSGINERNKAKLLKILESYNIFVKKDCQVLSTVKLDNVICIIISGHIQITKTDYNGKVTLIEELKDNDIFGTVLSSLNNDYDITAKTDTNLIIIDFDNIINDKLDFAYYNQFIKNLLNIFSNQIKARNERIEILTQKSIRDKLLAYFNLLSKNQVNKKITLPFSLADFANYLSIDRSAMLREMKNLREEGLIDSKGKVIYLKY